MAIVRTFNPIKKKAIRLGAAAKKAAKPAGKKAAPNPKKRIPAAGKRKSPIRTRTSRRTT